MATLEAENYGLLLDSAYILPACSQDAARALRVLPLAGKPKLLHTVTVSNSLGFPKPAGPRPETLLAGYKKKRAIDQTFPFQCNHNAASRDGAASPRQRRLRTGQLELFIFFF